MFSNDASAAFVAEVCSLVLKHDLAMELTALRLEHGGRAPERVVRLCRDEMLKKCSIDILQVARSDDVDGQIDRQHKLQQLRAQNLTQCLKIHFDIDDETLLAKKTYAVHPPFIPRKQLRLEQLERKRPARRRIGPAQID